MADSDETAVGIRPTQNPAARIVRVAAHGGIVFLAIVLLIDILSDDSVRLWPDKGFGLLVVGLALMTAIPAVIRTLRLSAPDWGENIAGRLKRSERLRLAIFGLVWVLYALLMTVVGFLVAATVAIAVSAIAVGRVRPWIGLLASIAVAVSVFFIFQRVLYVGLPLGLLDKFLIEHLPRL